jgi:hypothetical protein
MKPEEMVERFKPFAEKLRTEGRTDQEIQRVFRNFMDLQKSNARDKVRNH